MPGSKLGYFNSVLTDKGIPLAATITVFDQGTATPSTIYEDAGGVTPLANPFSTDAIGRFQFYAATGKYDVQVSGAGITTYKIQNVSLSDICNKPERVRFTGYTDKPAAGLFDAGCLIFFDDGSSGYIGCICTVGGAPGTWKYFGAIEA